MLCYMCWAGRFQYSSETNENSSLSPGISPIKFGSIIFKRNHLGIYNHTDASITRTYLEIKEEDMLSTYDMLEF